MRFKNIIIENFKQYKGVANFDLNTQEDKNIILIGGLNGYGKTNFLLSIVWCLYGERLSLIDDNFKKEIQKEGSNYSSFIQKTINRTAKENGQKEFSVSILIEDLDLPEFDSSSSALSSILVTRIYNVESGLETFMIINNENQKEIFIDNEDKVNFINDHIIPVTAAKFVFFDAEKIAEVANLSLKDEASFINDALGKILGLNTYESLIEDFENYINSLKKEGADKNLQSLIINKETEIKLSDLEIEKKEAHNAELLKEIDDLKAKIRRCDELITQNSKSGTSIFDRESLTKELENLLDKEKELVSKFNEMGELLPLVILTGNLVEVKEHLDLQEKHDQIRISSKQNLNKIDEFIELLFNKPPEPENSTLSMKDKFFYYEKAKNLSATLFETEENTEELSFEYDFNNSEKDLLLNTFDLINSQNIDVFQVTIEELNRVKIKVEDLNKKLHKMDMDSENEIIYEFMSEKDTAQRDLDSKNRLIGENNQAISKFRRDLGRINQELLTYRNKVEIDLKNKALIETSGKYVDVLNTFLFNQKNKHKTSLERCILHELKTLMHKLNSDTNKSNLIADVKVTILENGQGMQVTLLDQDDNEIKKESLSSGEKQIYISCLIKAILSESIQNLPIFIDTPLGRLDEAHRDSITKEYYPNLSEQVVLFSTNSEITPKRYREIEKNISKSYLLVNDGINTTLKRGYFNIAE